MYKRQLQAIAREASFPVVGYAPGNFILTSAMISDLRLKSYVDQWRTSLENGWYHLKLSDHSFFVFSEGACPSYSFVQCPLDLVTFAEFLAESGLEDTPENRKKLTSDYDQVIETASMRESVTPIRFDYHPEGYRSGVHPVAHIHVGILNNIRLSSNKMTAVSFVLFVMRHMYPDSWARLLRRRGARKVSELVRKSSMNVSKEFWSVDDSVELHLK